MQQIDYYPYGLIARNNIRTGDKVTKELFQGKTYEDLTGWYDFHARQYDAALGRWFGVDPQDQFSSPYLAMGNKPVMMVDPDGELAWFVPIIIGAVMNLSVNAAQGNVNNFWQGLGYAAVGAAAGALGGGLSAVISSAIGGSGFSAGFSAAFSGSAGLTGSGLTAASSSFFTGAAIGAGAGAGAGFTTGFGNSLLGGQSIGRAFGQGISSGLVGGASGGLLGGVLGGISATNADRSFWSGKMTAGNQTMKYSLLPDIKIPKPTLPNKTGSLQQKIINVQPRLTLNEIVVTASYYDRALAFEGIPYLFGGMTCAGLDCSGLVNRSTGNSNRVWSTGMGDPPGNWQKIQYNTGSHESFIQSAQKGDLFVWKGKHTAFSGGGQNLFHARRAGTLVGATNDLGWWLRNHGIPLIYRQIFK
ncbi:RHS repeat-associated core domain-containing protein [Belliella kenyensis]|uniref:RHS repeat-associated core domain-containing protein n=1 Tax=Belliella kenyensis TaxID=1472724 RepID=A0ABV8EQ97_9BACT|nr:RHS repeat-associated core domain-containing protein [Belliella kenyensis]MCH7401827.1 NlpC/P60 family protein [Belliella kenyensis]MDN3604327.1 RHS repeat-associated core domain-containing protein [Belliella kenyensis]